ncbi:TetR/AcrR family transcriptional regulator [Flavobacterium aquatile]|uniref:TetR family transcriptional regulator n=1 Tax=Flavobacterium aquatile LMG 4008 = ATCC 11947 TaxID=1453498 RepID=A0A095SYZ7_9FLAO|nr:TetR/AcrR family transcriptional regulator [Flavobacterium aquatile]KGD69574.1 TetR family transcriptional regulator [Flavobacterium aquatile LMG 4008 = ATCC 11947]OXA67291.1 TetR family transcriptional regulator [Flavobacterium aquatile LMG 4008 = ATCC 11947]GEC77951.1 TetR family transcriptional regulator [Flavobacterium aquatile]
MARLRVFNEDDALDKAIEIFWNKGYNGTSAQDLVTYLGLSRSSLYDTFGDKHSLFIKALKRYQKKSFDDVSKVLQNSNNIKETIKEIFAQAIIESFEDKITKGCFMVNSTVELALHDDEIANVVNENRQMMEEVFLLAVKRGQELNQISSSTDPRLLSRFLFNNYSGIRVLARSVGTPQQVFEDVLKVLLSVL